MNDECLTFKSDLADEPRWEGDDLAEPAGREHTRMIRSHLAQFFPLGRGPWNEEGYAWEFQVVADKIIVSVLVGEAEDEWRVYMIPVAFFGFLRRRAVRAAVKSVADSIESFLKGDHRFKHVRRNPEGH